MLNDIFEYRRGHLHDTHGLDNRSGIRVPRTVPGILPAGETQDDMKISQSHNLHTAKEHQPKDMSTRR